MHKSSISCGSCHGDYISRYVFTGTQALSSLATDPLGPRWPNAVKRSFTSIQTVHTHTHTLLQQGRWDGDENEMTMKMKWKLTSPGHKTGNAKRGKEKREKAPTPTHLSKTGELERAREKKRRTDDDTTDKARAKPTSARAGPKPDLTQEHTWNRGPMGN